MRASWTLIVQIIQERIRAACEGDLHARLIYTPGFLIVYSLAILNGKSSLVLMSGPKRNPP